MSEDERIVECERKLLRIAVDAVEEGARIVTAQAETIATLTRERDEARVGVRAVDVEKMARRFFNAQPGVFDTTRPIGVDQLADFARTIGRACARVARDSAVPKGKALPPPDVDGAVHWYVIGHDDAATNIERALRKRTPRRGRTQG